ncbi:hypothetical protein Leryth_013321 [Lithospermum erythrorhizon]|nr:hypothetical protein Leryth_013321 [Lithospermum erythrorhizon]
MALINTQHGILLILFTILFSSSQLVSAFEYKAGDKTGWIVPPPNDTNFYNHWASQKRFKPGDTIRFKYKKDSVMEVMEEDYTRCNSTRPTLFSNTGNSIYSLDRSGYFYFISGASGHCQKGQKMVVKVMTLDQESNSGAGGKSAASSLISNNAIVLFSLFIVVLSISLHI